MIKHLIAKTSISPNEIQFSNQIVVVVLTVLATIIPVTLIYIGLNLVEKTSLKFLTSDPAATANAPFYIGFFSNIGILLWCSSAVICLFSYAVLRQISIYRELSRFLLFSGLFTSFLMFDDLFMFHERVLPDHLGIPQKLVYVFYILIALSFLVKISKFVKKTEVIIFLAALGFLGLSLVCDVFIDSHFLAKLEDVFKIVGISCWLTYYSRLCLREVGSIVRLSSGDEILNNTNMLVEQ